MLCFIYCGRLRAEEWGGRFSIHIWGRTGSLEFQVPAPQVRWQPCLFSRCEGCTEVPSWRRGQDGDCRLLCRVSEIWAASCTKPFKNLRPLATKWLCECYALGKGVSAFVVWGHRESEQLFIMAHKRHSRDESDEGTGQSFYLHSPPEETSPMLWHKPRQKREATKMTDDGCHLLTDLVVWGMKVDFVWFINIKICDIAHVWSIESQFLLIKITFIQTSIHSKYWQVSTHMPKKTGIGVTFPTLPPQLKHPVMGIIDFLTSFYTLCPERPQHPV